MHVGNFSGSLQYNRLVALSCLSNNYYDDYKLEDLWTSCVFSKGIIKVVLYKNIDQTLGFRKSWCFRSFNPFIK